jgi:predicted TPR repeat methyltransferase
MAKKNKKLTRIPGHQKRKKQTPQSGEMPRPQSVLQQALSFHQAGHLHQAEKLYRQILQTEPNHPEASLHLGIIAHEVGKQAIAVELISRALANKPDYVEAYYNLGIVHLVQGNAEGAVAAFSKALAIKPDYVKALNNLGNAQLALGKLEKAAACYRRALTLSPDYAEASYNLGNVLDDLDKPDEAAACYRHALELKPDYVEAYYNLGILLQGQGKLNEAAACYTKALTLRPDYVEVYNNLGIVLQGLGKPDEAAVSYRRALDIKPDYVEVHNNLGITLKDQGQLEEAIASFRRALSLKPDYGAACSNLGYLYHQQGKIDEAVLYYKKAVELNHHVESATHFLSAMTGEQKKNVPSQYVVDLFDNAAERFDHRLVEDLGYRVPTMLRQLLDLHNLKGRMFANALDMGCGTGLSGIPFKSVVRKIVGVDLSKKMLVKAAAKEVYHALHQADLIDFLTGTQDSFDLIITADVFLYLGDLAPLFKATANRLCPVGIWLFSTETYNGKENYFLQPSGRFAHAPVYIENIAAQHNLVVAQHKQTAIRKDKEQWITGDLYLLTTGNKH